MKRYIFIMAAALLCILPANAQDVRTKATIDTNNVLIGDQIKLSLKAEFGKGISLVWPSIPDTLGKIEVVSRGKIDTLKNGDNITLKQVFALTAFDSGYYEIPQFTFVYEKKGAEGLLSSATNALMLKFATMQVDTAKPIKDIYGPLEPPMDWLTIFKWALGIILIIIAGYFGYRYYMKWKSIVPVVRPEYDPAIPPHIFALQSLKALEAERLWQSGRHKEYHIRLTEILRIYIERRYGFNAPEMTTEELLDHFKANNNSSDKEYLEKILEISDLAKFAKYQPLPEENDRCMKSAVAFVEDTTPHTPDNNRKGA